MQKLIKDMTDEEFGRIVRTALLNVPDHARMCVNNLGIEKDVEVYGTEFDGKDNWALTRLTGKWKIVITLEDCDNEI
jgi:hypothetical protein